jgi:hypothetical protein
MQRNRQRKQHQQNTVVERQNPQRPARKEAAKKTVIMACIQKNARNQKAGKYKEQVHAELAVKNTTPSSLIARFAWL